MHVHAHTHTHIRACTLSTAMLMCVPSYQVGKVVSLLSDEEHHDHFFEQGTRDFLVALLLHSRPALDSVLVTVRVSVYVYAWLPW